MIGEGFEPSPPKRLVPETSALDRSAIQPMFLPPWTSPVRRNMSWTSKKVDVHPKCAGRESNPGLVRGRDVYYHCTTGANVFVLGFEPRISRVLGERHNQARPYEQAWSIWVSIPVPRAC